METAEVFCLNVLRREPIDVSWVLWAKVWENELSELIMDMDGSGDCGRGRGRGRVRTYLCWRGCAAASMMDQCGQWIQCGETMFDVVR